MTGPLAQWKVKAGGHFHSLKRVGVAEHLQSCPVRSGDSIIDIGLYKLAFRKTNITFQLQIFKKANFFPLNGYILTFARELPYLHLKTYINHRYFESSHWSKNKLFLSVLRIWDFIYPGSKFFHLGSRIQGQKGTDCESGIFIPDAGSEFFHPGTRIQGQKGTGSRNRIRNTGFYLYFYNATSKVSFLTQMSLYIRYQASIEQLPDGSSIDFCGEDLSQSHLELRVWISHYSRIKHYFNRRTLVPVGIIR